MLKRKFTVRDMALVGVLAALVFAGSMIQVPLPTALGNTRLHLGNVMCLLSGLLVGPVLGGFAAGFGSLFFDLTNPLYISSAPFTFVFKFAMAFLCGLIAWHAGAKAENWKRNILAACCGAVLYVMLYIGKNFVYNAYFLRMEAATVWLDLSSKAVISGINGIIAAIASTPLAAAVRAGLKRAGMKL